MPSLLRCFPGHGKFNMSASGSPMTSEIEAAEHAWLESEQLLPNTDVISHFSSKIIATSTSVHTFAGDTFLSSSFFIQSK